MVRELPFDEWHRLVDLPIAANGLPSENVLVMVEENEQGEIIGVWSAGVVLMLEGLWVAEEYRKTTALGRLFAGMMAKLKEDGIDQAYSLVQTDEMLKLAEHGGFERIPGHLIVKDLKD